MINLTRSFFTGRPTNAAPEIVVLATWYIRLKNRLFLRTDVPSSQYRQLEAKGGHHDQLAGMVQSIEAFCQRVQHGLSEATFEQKRRLIELLIDRVVVTGEEVEIRYAIPTSPKGETIRFCHVRLDYFNSPVTAYRVSKGFHRAETE